MSWATHSIREKPEYWEWVASRAKVVKSQWDRGLVSVNDAGEVGGGVIFDNFTLTSCTVHIAIENPLILRAGFFNEVARFLFDVCEREVLLGITPGDNVKALRFNRHVGWEEIARIPNGQDHGVDLVIQTMRPDQCRWYRR